jgi:TRAP-type transport system small permease protein
MIFLMMLLVLIEVVGRYVFHHAPLVADEISAYLLVFIIFVGLGYTFREDGHIGVELIVRMLPSKVSEKLRLATLSIALIMSVLLTKSFLDLAIYSYTLRLRSVSWLMVPEYLPQAAMGVGASILCLQLIAEIIKRLVAKKDHEKKR